MKKFKRLGAFFTALALSASMLPSAFAAEDASAWTAREKAEGTARFAVFSDSHLITDTKRLDLALQSFSNIGGIDGVMMVGDVVYMQTNDNVIYPERYILLNDTINKYNAIKNLPIAYVMGNHEFPQGATDATVSANSQQAFIDGIGLNVNRAGVKEVRTVVTTDAEGNEITTTYPDAVYEMGGYTVVAASPEAYSNQMSAETEAWAKAKIEEALDDEANAGEPVFYLQHQPIQNTVRSSGTAINSADFMTWIKSQRRVINFTAHCHYSAYDPKSIWQSEDGFTAIHSPLLGGGYLGGLVGSYERDNITDAAYVLMVEVDKNNVVTVHKLDLYNGEEAGAPYVIDVNSDERLYTDARFENANAPVFKNNEAVTVDEVTGSSVTVSFPDSAVMTETVEGVSNDGFVLYWRVEAVNDITGDVAQYTNRYGDFWTKSGSDTRKVTVSNLERNTAYTINVYPVSPFIIQGEPISVKVTTTNDKSNITNLLSTKTLNVAAHKPVTSSNTTGTLSNLVNDNRKNGVSSETAADWFVVDLEKRYKIQNVKLYDLYSTDVEGGRANLQIEASNDPNFATFDVLGTLGDADDTVFPHQGCFEASGNGKAYRYVRISRTDGAAGYAYSEIKVYADQDVTEVTRKKNVIYDNQYSSTYAASKAVNGTISSSSDAWVSEQGGKYHFITVDMESPKNIGLIEMYGRRGLTASTKTQRQYWHIYGSNTLIEDKTILTANETLDEVQTGYKRYFKTGAVADYVDGEYIFPEYSAGKLQQIVPDGEAYRYLTFKRGSKGSTYLGEIRGFVLNPMVNNVSEENNVITIDFSDVMYEPSLRNNIHIYNAASNVELKTEISLSQDGYTVTVTPAEVAPFYKIVVADEVVNQYGTDLKEDYECLTDPVNTYSDFATKTDIYANVAMGKPVTSSSNFYSGYPKEWANDGITTTSTDSKVGSAIGSFKGWLQIDLQNRYNLEKIQYIPRSDRASDGDITYLEIQASNDPSFATYDTLDVIGSTPDETKLTAKGIWTIELDGTKDYRYIRVAHTATGEWSVSELRAYAKFDGISLTKNATADSYYQYHKTYNDAANYAPQKVLDGKTSTFHYVYVNGTYTEGKPNTNYTSLQVDLKAPYHIGYAELVARESGKSTHSSFYGHFDLFGSNIGDTVTDDNMATHPYLNTKYLETVDGYTKLYRSMNANNYSSSKDEYWPDEAAGVYKIGLNDATAYQYITHKTNSTAVGVEISEMRLYSIAQKVNRVDVAEDGRVTLNFAAPLIESTVNDETVTMVDAKGAAVELLDVAIDEYTYSFMPASEYGTITVSENVMNSYAVPMAEDFTITFEEPIPEVLENLTFTAADADATELTASTEYTFAGTFNNNEETTASIYAIVAIYDQYGRLSKVECEPYKDIAAGGEQAISVKITTDADVTGQTVYAYVLKSDFTPMWNKIDALLLNNN